MKKIKSSKAITLIALIITIIVLLILAGVVISFTVGNNGIIKKAQTAVGKYENAQEKENNLFSLVDIKSAISDGARNDTNAGYMMLSISITDITTSSFKINVNSVDADNHNILNYYVNDILVYSGKDKSFVVTNLAGNPLKEKERYEICVLAEPFKIGINTLEGDDVDSWLACIGNPNNEKYTIENLEELFQNETIMNNLLNSKEASEYLMKSTEKIFPALMNSKEGMKKLAKSTWSAYIIIKDAKLRSKLTNSPYKSDYEGALNKIPAQSNNNNVFVSSTYSNYYGYKAFDNNAGTAWFSGEERYGAQRCRI